MKLSFLVIGKTGEKYLKTGLEIYLKRLSHYCKLSYEVIPDLKNTKSLTAEMIKQKEGEQILKKLQTSDWVILLDEKGKAYSSVQFAKKIANHQLRSGARLVFVTGGAFGFSDAVYQRSNEKMSLSSMTFSHQMIRLFFLEQLYRAFTIIRNEPYHNE